MSYATLIIVAFIFNGLTSVGLKAATQMKAASAVPFALLVMYATGSLAAAGPAKWRPIERKNALIGAMAGLGASVGSVAAGRALQSLPGYIVFPMYCGGTILLVVLAGRVIFREKIGPYGLAGILVGMAAIALLSA
jgi:drug/metabolite transporter (DMT)-like permease